LVVEKSILFFMYLSNAFLLQIAFFWGLKKRRVYSALWGALFLFHLVAFPHLWLLLDEFGFDTLFLGQGLMLIGNTLLFFSCIGFDICMLKGVASYGTVRDWLINPNASKRRYLVLMLFLSFVIIAIQFRSGIERIAIGWEEARDSSSMVNSFTASIFDSIAIMFCFILFPSVWVTIRSRLFYLGFLLSLCCLAIFQIIGSRAVLLTIMATVYTELLLADLTQKKKISILLILSLIGFGLHTISRTTRGSGLLGIFQIILYGDLTEYIGDIGSIDLSGGESNIYRYYNYVIDKGYHYYPYDAWITIKRLLLLYVPTTLIPEIKPQDITYRLYSDAFFDGIFSEFISYSRLSFLLESGQTGSLHPTLWGDGYANGGLVGIFIYPIWIGFILVLIEKYICKLAPDRIFMIIPLTIAGYLMIARGNIVIGFGYLGYIIPLAMLLSYFPRFRFFLKKY
jgi:hypothetical protein